METFRVNQSAKRALKILLDNFEKHGIPVNTDVIAELEYIISSTTESTE